MSEPYYPDEEPERPIEDTPSESDAKQLQAAPGIGFSDSVEMRHAMDSFLEKRGHKKWTFRDVISAGITRHKGGRPSKKELEARKDEEQEPQ